MTFSKYQALLLNRRNKPFIEEEEIDILIYSDIKYPHTQALAIRLSIQKLDIAKRTILELCSFIDADRMPRYLLEGYLRKNEQLPETQIKKVINEHPLISLGSKGEKPGEDLFFIHRETQNQTKKLLMKMDKPERQEIIDGIMRYFIDNGKKGGELYKSIGIGVYMRTAKFVSDEEVLQKMAILLLDEEIKSGSKSDRSSLVLAPAYFGHAKVVKMLIERGAVVDQHTLMAAAESGHAGIMELLIKNNKEPSYLSSPMMRASTNGHTKIVELLLSHGVGVDVNVEGDSPIEGWTPLFCAAYNGHVEVVRLLIKKGANVNKRDGVGATPLRYAKQRGHTEVVELLRKNRVKGDRRIFMKNVYQIDPIFYREELKRYDSLDTLGDCIRSNLEKIKKYYRRNGHTEVAELLREDMKIGC